MGDKVYSEDQIRLRLGSELPAWSLDQGHLTRRYRTEGFRGALMVANAVGHVAEAAWHHPDLLISWGSAVVRLRTHSADGVTDKDFELARRIEEVVCWRPRPGTALEGTPDDPRYRYLRAD